MQRIGYWLLAILAMAATAGAQVREDDPHVSGQYGQMCLAVRQDSAAALAANGDYLPMIVDASGRLWVLAAQSGTWTVAGSGTFLVGDGTGPLTVDGTLTCDVGSGTQAVSGTVTANQGGTWTVQPGNTANTTPWLVKINDGSTSATVRDVTGANEALNVAITAADGSQVSSFGGGTQYTEGDTDATITGTALLWEDTSDTLRAASAAKPLPVNVVAGGAGDGAIQDGASPSIEASVFDYTNSNPLACRLTDTNGDYVAVGGGTQYNQGTVTTDTDTMTMAGAVRRDTAAVATGVVDGDRLVLSTDSAGRLRVTSADVTQPISAASLPLPTGAATAANQDGIIRDGTDDATQANVSGGALHVAQQGSVTVTATDLDTRNLNATDDVVQARGAAADGAAVTGNPVLIAGQDGTNAQSIKTDSTGSVQVDIESAPTLNVDTTSADQITPIGTAADGAAVSGNPLRIAGKDGSGNTQDIATDTSGELQVDVLTLPSVTVGTFPDNEPFNLNQLAGNGVSTGNGASGTGVLRVAQVNDGTGVLATVTTVTNLTNLPNEGQQTAANSISVTPDTDNDAIGTTAAAVPGEAMLIAGTDGTNVTVPYVDPCAREARTVFRVDIVTATTTEIAAATASEFYYVCSINLVTAAANNVIIVEDDTATNCPSPTAGVSSGGTTAAEGWNFAANGGIVVGTGSNWIMKTGTANRSFCIITSAATQLSGTITYVSAP